MHIQRGVKFLLHKRGKGDSKNLAIRMRVTLRGQTPIDFPTGHNIDTADWDMENQCALPSCEYATDINRTIDEWKSVMNEIFARFELLEKRIPTPGEVKDLFNDMVGRKTPTNASLTDQTDPSPLYLNREMPWNNPRSLTISKAFLMSIAILHSVLRLVLSFFPLSTRLS